MTFTWFLIYYSLKTEQLTMDELSQDEWFRYLPVADVLRYIEETLVTSTDKISDKSLQDIVFHMCLSSSYKTKSCLKLLKRIPRYF